MFSSQISRALLSDPYISKCFYGVFPCDKLPVKVKFPCAVVANTDPSWESGEHWVCYYIDKDGKAEYFDSYGLPPSNCELFDFHNRNGVNHNYNRQQLQGTDSDACGHYCIAFLTNRARGEPLQDIVDRYKGKYPGEKDELLIRAVNKEYDIQTKNKDQRGSGHFFSNQCCHSRLKMKCFGLRAPQHRTKKIV